MPRNSSGTYTLPAGNPVAPNTIIETNWANPTMSDIGTALTDSLDRFGRGSMLAPIKGIDGTSAAPMYAFSSESTLGIYRVSAGVLGFVMGGVTALTVAATAVTFDAAAAPTWAADPASANQLVRKSYADGLVAGGPFLPLVGGTLTGPLVGTIANFSLSQNAASVSGVSNPDAGASAYARFRVLSDTGSLHLDTYSSTSSEPGNSWIYTVGSNDLVLGTANTRRVTLSPTTLVSTVPWLGPNGDATNPAVSFAGDTNIGMYRAGADVLGFTTAGTFRLQIGTTRFLANLPWEGQDGSAAAPAFTFSSDSDTGIYRVSTNTMGLTASGTGFATLSQAAIRLYGATHGILGLVDGAVSGGTAGSTTDSFVIDSNGNAGITILVPDASVGQYCLGNASTASVGTFAYVGSTPEVRISSAVGDVVVRHADVAASFPIGFRNLPTIGNTATATAVAVGKVYLNTGGITINNSVFAAGDIFCVYNNSGSSISITQGTITTMRLAGTATTGTRTLAARGMATLFFPTATECVVSGSVT